MEESQVGSAYQLSIDRVAVVWSEKNHKREIALLLRPQSGIMSYKVKTEEQIRISNPGPSSAVDAFDVLLRSTEDYGPNDRMGIEQLTFQLLSIENSATWDEYLQRNKCPNGSNSGIAIPTCGTRKVTYCREKLQCDTQPDRKREALQALTGNT
jgi:hypothetical protein